MNKYRFRLTFIFIALIGFSAIASGVIAAKLLESSYRNALQDSMLRELRVMQTAVDWRSPVGTNDEQSYFTNKALEWRQAADARVTFIRSDGVVLGDSDHDPEGMDNHLQRVEVQQALTTGESGRSIRYSDTLKQNMLYVAVPAPANAAGIGVIRLAMSLEEVEASVAKLWQYLILGLGALFVVVAAISWRLAYGLTRPIEIMTKVAQRITHREYSARVRFQRRDEIGQLGHAINVMADSLQSQLTRISEDESRLELVLDNMVSGVLVIGADDRVVLLNRAAEEMIGFAAHQLTGKPFADAQQKLGLAGIIRECTEKQEHVHDEVVFYYPEERIVDVNVTPIWGPGGEPAGKLIVLHNITALRRLERMRSEFVANVSHELKTPIAAVKGFAETLLAGALHDTNTAKSFLQIIYDESERLNRLIGDILELSKIESKQVPLQFSPIEVKPFVERTMQMVQADAARKRIGLSMHIPDELYVEADEDRLRQILTNLVQNGINYTPEGGSVTVTVKTIGEEGAPDERLRFTVADTGIGIPKKDLPRIFERFYRVDKARSRSSGGTGLGLSIVKHLVELHHGTMSVESEVGLGSRFIFEIPVIQ